MKNTPAIILIMSIVTIILGFIIYAGYNFYRSEFMVCTNMPDGSNRCFNNSGDFIYELSEGEITIFPRDIHQLLALETYSVWQRTQEATITGTIARNPTAAPDGLTQDPTDAINAHATFEEFMRNQSTGTPEAP